jgi:lipid-binding SYLF domain-containing protein
MFRHPYITVLALAMAVLVAHPIAARDSEDSRETLMESIEVMDALVGGSDAQIPQYVLERAEALVIIPKLAKGGFIVGAEHGNGVMSVRDRATNTWSIPSFVKLTGGSIGWQIGFTSVDLVLVVVNTNAIDDLLENEFTLGASASIAAGPVGRSAEASTDVSLTAQILAYSRAKGLFAGATIEGAKLRDDRDANADVYGKALAAKELFANARQITAPAYVETWRKTIAGKVAGRS